MGKKALIYGSGAIGRGFLAPILCKYNYEISFVDIDKNLINEMKKIDSYKTAITKHEKYEIIEVPIKNAFNLGEEKDIENFDIIFSCVGPKNCYTLAEKFKNANTVISLENDSSTSVNLRKLTKNPNIYFGIPDVITSNTASKELLNIDPLMVISEQGILVLEKGKYQFPKEISQLEENDLNMHWKCKLFIHNAPHAITAYLGWLKKYTYIHEAMNDPDIEEVVTGSICEITDGIIAAGYASKEFANDYKEKELRRFKNNLLFDTISRVAREPMRKLAKDNRIILGMRVALFNKKIPTYTAIGAKAALIYNNHEDEEAAYLQSLRDSISDAEILREYSGIELFDPLNKFIIKQNLSKFKAGGINNES